MSGLSNGALFKTDIVQDDTEWWICPEIRSFEESMWCPICKDVIQIAVSLPCSHTFCSQCIRYALDTKCNCPVCKEVFTQNDLKKNSMVDHIVASFAKARPKFVDYVKKCDGIIIQKAPSERPPAKNNMLQESFPNPCISASKRIKNNLNYDIMSLKQIKDKMTEYNIPVIGKDKTALVRRLKNFIIEYNTCIDSGTLKSNEQIVDKILSRENRLKPKLSIFKKNTQSKEPNIHKLLIDEIRQREQVKQETLETLENDNIMCYSICEEDYPQEEEEAVEEVQYSQEF
ncbi:postreplication repair E3 ubiquitin-protein ligase rad18 [Acrasis kona]|uniref:RING-type E3 ubiquitin transferase n=1 Tax=Acrasis kona TaxID=1008807 RepID=A0AAW2YHP9_9EUKA